MIVRIMELAQFDVPKDRVPAMQVIDQEAHDAFEAEDEAAYKEAHGRLVAYIREHGTRLPDEDTPVAESIVPPVDTDLEYTRKLTLMKPDGFIRG